MKSLKLNQKTGRKLLTEEPKFVEQLPVAVTSQGKNLKITDKTIMVRTALAGTSSITRLIVNTVDKAIGVTDFAKGKLDDNTNVIVRAVSFAVGTHATETNPAKIFFSKKMSAATDAAIRSAVIRIRQNNRLLFEAKVSDLMVEELERGSNGMNGFELEEEFFLKQDVEVFAEIEYPLGLTVDATAKWFSELSLIGQATSAN